MRSQKVRPSASFRDRDEAARKPKQLPTPGL